MKFPKMLGPRSRSSLACALCLSLYAGDVCADALSEEVPVPGGTLAVARALGVDTAPERPRFVTELTRVIYLDYLSQ